MTEQEKADLGKNTHPLWRLIAENPISAMNAAMILVGGAGVYYSNENRMSAVEARVFRVEQQMKDESIASSAKDDRATAKIEAITRDVTDVKVTVRGIDTAVQFLVRQAQPSSPASPIRGPQ